MDLQLDHLVVVVPDLAAGAAHILETTGLEMAVGGKHGEMGTHNLLLGLSDIFLEAIAIDPSARPPNRPRWFAMDDSVQKTALGR